MTAAAVADITELTDVPISCAECMVTATVLVQRNEGSDAATPLCDEHGQPYADAYMDDLTADLERAGSVRGASPVTRYAR